MDSLKGEGRPPTAEPPKDHSDQSEHERAWHVLGVRVPYPARAAQADVERRLDFVVRFLLIGGMLLPLVVLIPDLLYLTPDINDGAFHQGVARETMNAVREGQNPLDFWVPTWMGGYPLFHYYQPGPYLLLALLHLTAFGKLSLLLLLRLTLLVAAVLFPLANYKAMRWLELPRETAAAAAFLSWMVSGGFTYGIEFSSFTWAGWGLYAQAIALPFLPLALAGGWRAVHHGGRTFRYALILFGAFMSHILYGYLAAISLPIAVIMVRRPIEVVNRLGRLARFYLQSGALLAFFVVPLMLHSAYHAKSLYDAVGKFDSYGAKVILTRLFSGWLLDHERLPVMTSLLAAGLLLCARRWLEGRSMAHGWIACGFGLWLVLYFGRPTWGGLLKFLPMSHGLHFERLSNGVHLFAIWLAAVALGSLVRSCLGVGSRRWTAAALVLFTLIVAPLVGNRVRYGVYCFQQITAAKSAFDEEAASFNAVLRRLRQEPPGRVYAGHSGNWGSKYKVGSVKVYHLLSASAIPDIGNVPFSWPLPADFGFQFNPLSEASYELFDVRYVLTDQREVKPPHAELLIHEGKHYLYRVNASSGRFGLVSVPLAVEGDKETSWYTTMSWIKSLWAPQRAHAALLFGGKKPESVPQHIRMTDQFRYVDVTEGPNAKEKHLFDQPGLFAGRAPAPPRGRLMDEVLTRQEASVTVELEEPGFVLFKTTYHPWWQAWLDGTPVETLLLTPGFTGIGVPAGEHELRLAYRTGWLKLLLLTVGLGVALGLDRWWVLPGVPEIPGAGAGHAV